MSENLKNQRYPQTIESQIFLDQLILNQNNILKNQISNNSSERNNLIINNKNNYIFQSNILLNSIQDFCNRYEKDDKKIILNKKFIVTFQDLISLIKEAIIAQQQINKLIFCGDNNNINIQRINQKYINDLSYNIFSYDKIDIGYNFNIQKKKKNYSNISPNIMKFRNNPKMKKSYISQDSISPNNIKKEINSIFENIYKEVFINRNGSNPLDNINQKNQRNINLKKKILSKSDNNIYGRNKSATINKKNISPLRFYKISKNKTVYPRLNNRIITNNISNSINYNNNNININNNYNSHCKSNCSLSADKNLKNDKKNNKTINKSKVLKNVNKNKNELKCSDIYLACENINMIKNSGNKKLLSKSSNDFNDNFLKRSLKTIGFSDNYSINNYSDIIGYEELHLNNGIKRIIISNTHNPSNLANKLLISGQKYIDDFKEMNECTKKKYM